MLQTVEAEIDVNGEIRLLEPLRVEKKTRAIITLLENGSDPQIKPNTNRLLELLRNPEFVNRSSYSAAEIEAQIEENRNSWE